MYGQIHPFTFRGSLGNAFRQKVIYDRISLTHRNTDTAMYFGLYDQGFKSYVGKLVPFPPKKYFNSTSRTQTVLAILLKEY